MSAIPRRRRHTSGSRIFYRTCGCIVALAIVLGAPAASIAQVRDKTFDDVPLRERVDVEVNGVLLRVPAGYIWPTRRERGHVNVRPEMFFRFWMPDKRWPEVPAFGVQPVYRPHEQGRPRPGNDTYLVYVFSASDVALSTPGYLSPEAQFHNLTAHVGVGAYNFEVQPFGLVRFWPKSSPGTIKDRSLDYRHIEGSDPMVLFSCQASPLDETVGPYASCQGYAYLAADRLSLEMRFPRDALPRWADIVCAARDLFLSWRVSPPAEAGPCGAK